MKIKKKWVVLFLFPGMCWFAFVYLFSIMQVVTTSFCEWRIAGEITFTGIENYIQIFASESFRKALLNNVIWIVLQSTVHVLFGVIFALIVSRGKRYSGFFRTVYMLPNIISSAALGMLFYNIFNPMYGPVNKLIQALGARDFKANWFADTNLSFFAVTLTWLPFAAIVSILVIAELTAISNSVLEAAIVDGASEFQLIWYVKLPLVRGAIGTGTILAATSMLQKLDILAMTSNGGPGNKTMNLPLLIYKTAFGANNFGQANAQGVVLIIVGLFSIGIINKIYRMNEPV